MPDPYVASSASAPAAVHAVAPPADPAQPGVLRPRRRLSEARTCTFEVATSLSAVLEAWRVLHDAYVRAGFIRPHATGIHACRQAMGPHALVALARSHGQPVTTITAIGDNRRGLPLDAVYPDELAELRGRGARLLEIGMFGDRRDIAQPVDRAFTSLFELMRYTFFFGLHTGVTDFLCGIPPRRAPLYMKCFGFRPVGETRHYSAVRGEPVVLMHVDTPYLLAHGARHRAVETFFRHPLPPETFAKRFPFDAASIRGTALEGFLRPRVAADAVDAA